MSVRVLIVLFILGISAICAGQTATLTVQFKTEASDFKSFRLDKSVHVVLFEKIGNDLVPFFSEIAKAVIGESGMAKVTLGVNSRLPEQLVNMQSPAKDAPQLRYKVSSTKYNDIFAEDTLDFRFVEIQSGFGDPDAVQVGFLQTIISGQKSFAPSVFVRFPIRDDLVKALRKTLGRFAPPTVKEAGLDKPLFKVGLYLAGSVTNDTNGSVSGLGIGLAFSVFKQTELIWGPMLSFETDDAGVSRGGIIKTFVGLSYKFN